MEITRNPQMRLSDIKNWDALHATVEHNYEGNTIQGAAELVDCKNVFVSADVRDVYYRP